MVQTETEASAGGPMDREEDAPRAGAPSGPGLPEELPLLRVAWEVSPDAVLFVHRATLRVAAANPAACQMLGYTLDELRGTELPTIVAGAPGLLMPARGDASGATAQGCETLAVARASLRRRGGAVVPVECRVCAVGVSADEYLVLVARPAGEGRSARAEEGAGRAGAAAAAGRAPGDPPGTGAERGSPEGRDAVTGLADRRQFEGRLLVAMRKARCRGDYHFAVLFIDLDGFKAVNDAWGHLHGDRVLQEIGARLAGCLRPEDMVARFGGDEFTVLLDHLRSPSDAVRVAERIRLQLETPVEIEGRRATITASIGIALSWHGYRDPEAMLHDADRAMYRAKAEGKARYFVWAP